MKVASLCFEVCYPQRNALSVKKSKAKRGKIRHVSRNSMRQRIVGYYSFFFWSRPENIRAVDMTIALETFLSNNVVVDTVMLNERST